MNQRQFVIRVIVTAHAFAWKPKASREGSANEETNLRHRTFDIETIKEGKEVTRGTN